MDRKRALCKAKMRIRWEDIRSLEPGPEEALIRITHCGVCASDIHDLEGNLKDWQPLGHEMIGIVEKAGGNVKNISVRMPVAIRNATACGECDECRQGIPRFCQHIIHCVGGFATHVTANAKALMSLGDLSQDDAVLIEPLNVALDLIKTAELQDAGPVVIVGPGPIGILAAYVCAYQHRSPLWVIGHKTSVQRLELLQRLPTFQKIYNAHNHGWANEARRDIAGLNGAKFLITTPPVSIPKIILPIAPSASIFCTIGLAAHACDELLKVPVRSWMFRRYQLRMSFAYPNLYFEEARKILKNGLIPTQQFITHHFPLSKVHDAFECVRRREDGLIKAVVEPGDDLRARPVQT